jgi:hypothetical protein
MNGDGTTMPYKIIEKHEVIIDAPQLKRTELVTMTEAADLLKKSVFQIRNPWMRAACGWWTTTARPPRHAKAIPDSGRH